VLAKAKASALGLTLSNNQEYMAVYGSDHIVRVWSLLTGRLVTTINETIARALEIQNDQSCPEHTMFKIDPTDFDRRVNLDRELER
jgi:hypothetical protein